MKSVLETISFLTRFNLGKINEFLFSMRVMLENRIKCITKQYSHIIHP